MPLDRRAHILLDAERQRRLRERSAATGRSVGELIREAIDHVLAADESREEAAAKESARALEGFMSAEPMPIQDWPDLERELEGIYERSVDG